MSFKHIYFILCVLLLSASSFADETQPMWITDIEFASPGVWCATHSGLYSLDFAAGLISWYTPVDFGARYDTVREIIQAPDSSLWITAYDDFIMRYDSGDMTEIDISKFGEYPDILDAQFHNTETWFLGARRLIKDTGSSWTEYADIEWGGYQTNALKDFTIGVNDTVWAVGDFGLIRVEQNDNSIIEDSRFRGYGYKVFIDDNNVIWIGARPSGTHEGGLIIIDGMSITTYTTENSDLPLNTVLDLASDSQGVLWLCAGSNLVSFDGDSWVVYDENDCPALNNSLFCIAIDENDTKWIGTNYNGLLSFDGTTWTQYLLAPGPITTAVEQQSDTPSAIDLLPAYPNPFNPKTTISYTLPEATDVTLTVHSVTGQQVAVLADEYMGAGSHSVVFDGEGLASGMYFYRLKTADVVRTEKMLLVK